VTTASTLELKQVLIISINNYFHGKLSSKEKQTIKRPVERNSNATFHFVASGRRWCYHLQWNHHLASGVVWFILRHSKHTPTHDYL
jgi:hypothetical protein